MFPLIPRRSISSRAAKSFTIPATHSGTLPDISVDIYIDHLTANSVVRISMPLPAMPFESGTGGGGQIHRKDDNSMAVCGVCYKCPQLDLGRPFLLFNQKWIKNAEFSKPNHELEERNSPIQCQPGPF